LLTPQTGKFPARGLGASGWVSSSKGTHACEMEAMNRRLPRPGGADKMAAINVARPLELLGKAGREI
jgi:hypothetical protein